MKTAADIVNLCHGMKVGENLQIYGSELRRAFSNRLDPRPPEDQLLEKLIGANYGAFRINWHEDADKAVISRHEPGDTKVREDWDRR